ncbi:hypothetical protein [Nakamurella lactea]|uniref:hypothetical protein n=1 Tax=Nakamurella lactea TaxID=459515 RepID=UPI0004127AEA|nr:hypothetical protein [Nakamurella lactea]
MTTNPSLPARIRSKLADLWLTRLGYQTDGAGHVVCVGVLPPEARRLTDTETIDAKEYSE